jgi:hypothetical protein
VQKAAEMIHVQMNEKDFGVEVINNLPAPVDGAKVRVDVFRMDGTVAWQKQFDVTAAASSVTRVGAVDASTVLADANSAVHFVRLQLVDASEKVVSENFYWKAMPEHEDDLTALEEMPVVKLEATVARRDFDGRSFFDVTLRNPEQAIALMAHVQLRKKKSGERVLPVYASDNYVSLIGGATKMLTLEAATGDLKSEDGLVVVDGWNVGVGEASVNGAGVAINTNAQVDHWPVTGLPMEATR